MKKALSVAKKYIAKQQKLAEDLNIEIMTELKDKKVWIVMDKEDIADGQPYIKGPVKIQAAHFCDEEVELVLGGAFSAERLIQDVFWTREEARASMYFNF